MGDATPSLSTDISVERARYYRSTRWSGPVGTGSAIALWAALVQGTDRPPDHLGPWLLFMAVATIAQALTFTIDRFATATSNDGLPKLGHVAYAAMGAGFGTTLWLDLDATATDHFRWVTLACLFAMSAGVVSGFSGVTTFGQLVAIPMWVGATSALIAIGDFLAATASAIFAVITIRDMIRNGQRWTELFQLRIQSEEAAVDNLWAATHDPLTELVNRHGFMQLLERATADQRDGAMLFVDLDHFKEVNDRFGHAAGDHVLQTCAARLVDGVRPGDVVARMGGDEFCVLIETNDHAVAEEVANRLIDTLEAPIEGPWGAELAFISASVGIASLHSLDPSSEQTLLEADFALYEAKRTGRRRVVRFDQALQSEITERSGLESKLRNAIRRREISAVGQPVFDLTTGRVTGVELLARWQLDDGTPISPAIFIPMAESIGLIGDMTEIMFETAGRCVAQWADDPTMAKAVIAINVSPIDFRRGQAADRVRRCLKEYRVPGRRVMLEITESHELDIDSATIDQVDDLRALGVGIAIDDFGTGYSSLDQLLSLPVDAVKLDRSLIGKLATDERQPTLVRSIHDLATAVSSHVVAEGIETAEQLDLLRSLGVRLGQGYHLCRPVALDELPEAAKAGAELLAVSEGSRAGARRGAASGASSSE